LLGEAIWLWDVPCSERDSNEAKLATDCLFRLRLGAVGRDMRRKGKWVTRGRGERGDDTEPLSGSVEGKNNWAEEDIAWMWERPWVVTVQLHPRASGNLYACVRIHPPETACPPRLPKRATSLSRPRRARIRHEPRTVQFCPRPGAND
jgi:hypothetical protein